MVSPKRRIYISFSKLSPRRYRNYITDLIKFGGDKKYPLEDWLGSANILSFLVFFAFIISSFAFFGSLKITFLLYAIASFVAVHFYLVIILQLKVEDRRNRIEEALPDLLQLTGANIRSGMSPFRALQFAAKKEFGPLKDEIEYITAKSQGVVNFSDVLLQVNKRVNSDILERILRLFSNAIKTGGHLTQLLEDLAKDIIETRSLKKELVTSTKAYTMFIFFLVIVGTPLLLSISLQFLSTILEIQPEAPTETVAGVGNLIGEISISTSFLLTFSIVVLIVTSFLASMLIGVIKEGNYFNGFRYAPFIAIASIIAFFVLRFLVSTFFGG